ncbi:MAG: hypothetical protein M3Z22_05115, partial [Verrucomicrobiota bacterium]|nr:hypothetical protein [Verrucomicrobiota bacterium]
AALLPRETLAFVHVPDVSGARAQWHETDIYKLWREPAVQDFLQRPLALTPTSGNFRQQLAQADALKIRDAFVAITAWDDNGPKIVAGFRFQGSADDAEKFIARWQGNAPEVKRETVTYQQHQIAVVTRDTVTTATVYDRDWFLAADDIPTLKTFLDRIDGRMTDRITTLAADEEFASALKRMPATYVAFGYGRLERFFSRIAKTLPASEQNGQGSLLRRIRTVAATTNFENGKFRDVVFVAMPKAADEAVLTRSSLALTTSDSFLYFASLLNLPNQMPEAGAAAANGFPAAMQSLLSAFTGKGITLDYWKSAFGPELGVIGDWPQNSRIPALLATLPVRDAGKAKEIAATAAAASAQDDGWTASVKDGVQYYSRPPTNPMVPIAPTIALSDALLVAGLDADSVENAMKRAAAKAGSGVSALKAYQEAQSRVPAAKHSFTYLDTALFYTRLDAAVRPMLIMAAAFVPNISQTVDLGKLPPAEVIAKHLSPIVMSQNYESDGYRTESFGPISMYQAAVGVAVATGAGTSFLQRQLHGGPIASPAGVSQPTPPAPPAQTPVPTP